MHKIDLVLADEPMSRQLTVSASATITRMGAERKLSSAVVLTANNPDDNTMEQTPNVLPLARWKILFKTGPGHAAISATCHRRLPATQINRGSGQLAILLTRCFVAGKSHANKCKEHVKDRRVGYTALTTEFIRLGN